MKEFKPKEVDVQHIAICKLYSQTSVDRKVWKRKVDYKTFLLGITATSFTLSRYLPIEYWQDCSFAVELMPASVPPGGFEFNPDEYLHCLNL